MDFTPLYMQWENEMQKNGMAGLLHNYKQTPVETYTSSEDRPVGDTGRSKNDSLQMIFSYIHDHPNVSTDRLQAKFKNKRVVSESLRSLYSQKQINHNGFLWYSLKGDCL